MPRRIESHLLDGPAGKLEALLEEPEEGAPRESVLVCHPHPQYGGTMHNKVVYRIARGMRKTGCVVLRFNYRGVNRSEGEYDRGRGETEDARACLDWLRTQYPELPISLAGFSFGSRVVLRLAPTLNDGVRRVIAAGFPTRYPGQEYLQESGFRRIFIQSTRDEHGPRAELEQIFATVPEPKRLVWIEAEDHFFAGALDAFEAAVMSEAAA
jgi:alpha/beta superfamily hydrolase